MRARLSLAQLVRLDVLVLSVAVLMPVGCQDGRVDDLGTSGAETDSPEAVQVWNQWRGGDRDAVLADFTPPALWPETLEQAWTIEVGAGYASPIVSEAAAFVHTRGEDVEIVTSLALDTGEILWSDSYPALRTKAPEFADIEGEGPYSTPLLHSGRLHTVGVNGIVSTYNASSGELLWRRDFSDLIVETQRFCGVAPSPLMADDQLVVQVGDDDSGEVMALDPSTGETLWSWASPATGNASPNVAELDGIRQIVTMTDEGVVGLDIDDGSLLWEHSFPGVPGSCSTNIPSPILGGDSIILTAMRQGAMAIAVTHGEGGWETELLWQNDEIEPLWSNFALDTASGALFGVSAKRKGQLFCADAGTGSLEWISDGRAGENGFTVLGGDLVFFLMNEGDLVVARRTDQGLEREQTYTVADAAIWSYPVILDRGILVKAGSTLSLWSLE